jgi:selenocysteine lyase/cysteine desulfurase
VFAPGHRRHEAGSPNLLGAVALAAASDALAALPAGAVEEHEGALRDALVGGLEALPGVDVLRLWPDAPDVLGVAAFTVAGVAPAEVAEALAAEHGISVRDGRFCAHPLLRRLGHPEGAVRASLGLDSCAEDVERFLHGLERLVR